MPQTPARGLTYPAPGDHTRLWEHFQTLAEDVDGELVTVRGATQRVILTFDNQGRTAWNHSLPFTPSFALAMPEVSNTLPIRRISIALLNTTDWTSKIDFAAWEGNTPIVGQLALHIWAVQ